MKKALNYLLAALIGLSCIACNEAPKELMIPVTVDKIVVKVDTVVMRYSKSNNPEATGVAVGAGIGYFLGGDLTSTALGGAVGYAVADEPTTETWTQKEEKFSYNIHFSDGYILKVIGHNYYHKGQTVCGVCHNDICHTPNHYKPNPK